MITVNITILIKASVFTSTNFSCFFLAALRLATTDGRLWISYWRGWSCTFDDGLSDFNGGLRGFVSNCSSDSGFARLYGGFSSFYSGFSSFYSGLSCNYSWLSRFYRWFSGWFSGGRPTGYYFWLCWFASGWFYGNIWATYKCLLWSKTCGTLFLSTPPTVTYNVNQLLTNVIWNRQTRNKNLLAVLFTMNGAYSSQYLQHLCQFCEFYCWWMVDSIAVVLTEIQSESNNGYT